MTDKTTIIMGLVGAILAWIYGICFIIDLFQPFTPAETSCMIMFGMGLMLLVLIEVSIKKDDENENKGED